MKKFLIVLMLLLFAGQVSAASITITIPDGKANAIIDAFATQYNYQDEIGDEDGNMIPNPQTKKQFALEVIKSFVREVYKATKVKEVGTTIEQVRTGADDYTDEIAVE